MPTQAFWGPQGSEYVSRMLQAQSIRRNQAIDRANQLFPGTAGISYGQALASQQQRMVPGTVGGLLGNRSIDPTGALAQFRLQLLASMLANRYQQREQFLQATGV